PPASTPVSCGASLLHQLQPRPLLLVQQPHQPAQLPHLGPVSAMHRAGLHDALQALRRPWASTGAAMVVTPAVAHRRRLARQTSPCASTTPRFGTNNPVL